MVCCCHDAIFGGSGFKLVLPLSPFFKGLEQSCVFGSMIVELFWSNNNSFSLYLNCLALFHSVLFSVSKHYLWLSGWTFNNFMELGPQHTCFTAILFIWDTGNSTLGLQVGMTLPACLKETRMQSDTNGAADLLVNLFNCLKLLCFLDPWQTKVLESLL